MGRSAILGVATAAGRKLLVFGYSILFVRILGADLYGVFVAFEMVVRPLSIIAAVGGQHLVVSELVRARSENVQGRVTAVINAKMMLTIGIGLAAALLVAVFAADLHQRLGGFPNLDRLFRVWSWWIVPLGMVTILGGILVGFGRSSTMFILTNIVEPLAGLAALPILWILLQRLSEPWLAIVLPEAFGSIVVVAAAIWLLRREAGAGKVDLAAGWSEVPRVAALGLPLLVHSIAGLAFIYSARLMVGGMLGDAEALGVYNIALVLAGFMMLFHRSIVTVISPSVSDAVARGDLHRVQQLYRESAETSFLLAAVGYLWLVLFGAEILALYGPGFAAYSTLLAIVTWGQLIDTFAGCGGYLLIARGKGHYLMYNSILTVALNIGLNWILIRHYGLMGAAIATAMSYVVKNGLIVLENAITDGLHPFTPYHLGTLAATIIAAVGMFVLRLEDLPLFVRAGIGAVVTAGAAWVLLNRATVLLPRLRRGLTKRT